MRNYDKEPIILEDYNASFAYYSMKYVGFPLMFTSFIIYPLISGNHIKSSFASMGVIMIPMYRLFKQSKLRKIVLKQNRIEYVDSGDPLAIIDLNEPINFHKSFQNYYYKKQNFHFFYFVFLFFFVGLLMHSLINGVFFLIGVYAVVFIVNQITKYILSDHGFLFFSSVLVEQDEDVISIPIYIKKDYQEVNDYLKYRGIDMQRLPIFFKPLYGTERAPIFSSNFEKDIVCPKCRKSLNDSSFSCSHCGNPLTNEKMIETTTNDNYHFKAILRDKKYFINIKELLRSQYEPLGYTKAVIDKEDSLMLKNEANPQSYVSIKYEHHNFSIEAYNTVQPTIKSDAQEYFY
jgi:hypothetical protein